MASGRGSNAEALLEACAIGTLNAKGTLVISNYADAGVHEVASHYDIPSRTLRRDDFEEGVQFAEAMISAFRETGTDLICLAGYMRKVPPAVIRAFPKSILNIHPALLPKHGGKGLYGIHVHEAVIAEGDRETGVTIHFVDPEYDRGPILLQRGGIEVFSEDTPKTLAARVLELEHSLYVEAVKRWLEES